MDWLVLTAPSALLVLVVLLPGWAVLTVLGRRSLRSLTAAPAVSIGIMVLAGLVSEVSGWRWGPAPVVVMTLLLTAAGLVLRRSGGRSLAAPRSSPDPADRWRTPTTLAGIVGVAGGLVLWIRHLTNVLPSPTAFSQTWDNVFHLNVIRFIHDIGDPGPWLPRNLDPDAVVTLFYPTAWHQLATLTMPATGGSVQLASNAVLFVVCAVVWPLSVMELILTLGVRTPGALLSTGVLAAAFSAYPFLMLDWGVLYPNLLSYAIVPAALAVLVDFLRAGPDPRRPLLSLAFVTALTGLGVLLGHPNGFLLLLALALPAVLDGALRTGRLARNGRVTWWRATLWWAGAAGGLAVFARIWQVARPSNRPWPPLHDVGTALTQGLLANPIMGPPGVVVAALTVVGLLLLAVRPRHWWFLGASAIGMGLWVVGSGAPDGALRELLTGSWYSDSYRLAPILTLLAVPASAFAVDRLMLLRRHGVPAPAPDDPPTPLTSGALGVSLLVPALILAATQFSPSLHQAVTHASTAYDFADVDCAEGDVTCLVTADEFAILMALPELTPPDAVLLAEPRTGASLAYAFTERSVLRPYIGAVVTPAEQLLLDDLDTVPQDPNICEALAGSGVTHVLHFGTTTVHSTQIDWPGLDDLDASPAVRLLAQQGEAALYEVVACR